MQDHVFVGKIWQEDDADLPGPEAAGYPVVRQVPNAPEGALSQVCSICDGQAAENGSTPDHLEDTPENRVRTV